MLKTSALQSINRIKSGVFVRLIFFFRDKFDFVPLEVVNRGVFLGRGCILLFSFYLRTRVFGLLNVLNNRIARGLSHLDIAWKLLEITWKDVRLKAQNFEAAHILSLLKS